LAWAWEMLRCGRGGKPQVCDRDLFTS
jgi:hypothetical protein